MKPPVDIQDRRSKPRAPSPARNAKRARINVARLGFHVDARHDSTVLRLDEQFGALDAAIRNWNRLRRRSSRLEPNEILYETLIGVLRIKDLAHRLSVTVCELRRETSTGDADDEDEI